MNFIFTTTLTNIFVQIPFRSQGTFNSYNLFLPVDINSFLHSIHIPNALTLVSADFLHIALPNSSLRSHCHSSLHPLHICPTAPLSILPASSNPCITVLVETLYWSHLVRMPKLFKMWFAVCTSIPSSFYNSSRKHQSWLPVWISTLQTYCL